MEKKVIFRQYQEQVAEDHDNSQDFAQESFDHIVNDAITKSRRYAGFNVTKTGQTEITAASGRFYDVDGAIYNIAAPTVLNMLQYLAAASQVIVAVTAYGQVSDTDVQERDFLVDVSTGATEPRAVAMERSRLGVLSLIAGAESADPQPPATPANHTVIAHILLDTTQVVSITMQEGNEVASTEDLDGRADDLEAFRAAAEPRISSLASDIAALSNQINTRGDQRGMEQLFQDMAVIKATLEIPSDAADYGADRFLDEDLSDAENDQALGYDALIEEGIRFPDANASVAEIGIFSANDPNAALSNGLLLPAYDNSLKLSALTYHSDLGIAQYGFQDVEIVQQTMSRRRIRYGGIFTVSTGISWWRSGKFDAIGRTFTRAGEAFELLDPFVRSRIQIIRVRKIWVDTFLDPYWKAVTVNHNITGAQVAQSFLVSNDFWLTKLSVYFTAKAAAENVFLSLVEVTNGVPDVTKAVLHQTLDHDDMVVNGWTDITTVPTFLKSGTRYALLVTSNANHRVGMAFGQAGLEGTFFYSTDGAYFQGDLTKSMMLKLWGAKFRAAQVAIQLNALNLDGGIRDIDVLAMSVVPDSSQLIWEVQPQGGGAFIPLDQANLSAFDATPPLALFRARMVGTQDVAPGLMLTGSQVSISRPKVAFKHISLPIELAAPSSTIKVKLRLEDFDDTPHDCGMRLRVAAAWETPDVTEDVVIDADTGQLYRTFTFNLGAPTDTFSIEITGTTNNAGNTFHVAERVHWAL